MFLTPFKRQTKVNLYSSDKFVKKLNIFNNSSQACKNLNIHLQYHKLWADNMKRLFLYRQCPFTTCYYWSFHNALINSLFTLVGGSMVVWSTDIPLTSRTNIIFIFLEVVDIPKYVQNGTNILTFLHELSLNSCNLTKTHVIFKGIYLIQTGNLHLRGKKKKKSMCKNLLFNCI